MEYNNLLYFKNRTDFRKWLMENCTSEKECWLPVKRGKTPPEDCIWYLDAVEEALCFGWTELNKERCRRLEKLGLMTDQGRKVCPNLNEDFIIEDDVFEIFRSNPSAWANFQTFPALYQRVRVDNIQNFRGSELFASRLSRLIEASEKGQMIGDWNDYGRLLEY